MAELLLKVGTVGLEPKYQDGDIVCAFNDVAISQRHLYIIGHPRLLPPGHRSVDSSAFDFYSLCRYKFERVSRTEVLRTDTTGALPTETFSRTPNANGEQIDVVEYIRRRLMHPNHLIFGTPGLEVWFGGKPDYAAARLDNVWTAVEAREGLLKADHDQFPITETEKRHFLPITIAAFDNAERSNYQARDVQDVVENGEEREILLKKRVAFVDWENLDGMTPGRRVQVRDGGRSADHRRSLGSFDKSIVIEKPITGRRSTTRT